jgi:hypothetical protein
LEILAVEDQEHRVILAKAKTKAQMDMMMQVL